MPNAKSGNRNSPRPYDGDVLIRQGHITGYIVAAVTLVIGVAGVIRFGSWFWLFLAPLAVVEAVANRRIRTATSYPSAFGWIALYVVAFGGSIAILALLMRATQS